MLFLACFEYIVIKTRIGSPDSGKQSPCQCGCRSIIIICVGLAWGRHVINERPHKYTVTNIGFRVEGLGSGGLALRV